MNPNESLKFALLAGEIMLSSGAETYRVEDTIKRILSNCHFELAESFVTTTGIFACIITDSESNVQTMFKRVRINSNNFEKIAIVNDISRNFAEGKITIPDAMKKLNNVKVLPPYSPFIKVFSAALATFAFTYIFGGQIPDCINSLFTGLILQLLIIQLQRSNVNSVIMNIFGGAIIAFLSLSLLNLGIGINIDKIIIGSIMPLVPGIAITNAIRDILEGDYLSGTTRIMDAFIIGIAIATGIGTVMKIWIDLFGGILI